MGEGNFFFTSQLQSSFWKGCNFRMDKKGSNHSANINQMLTDISMIAIPWVFLIIGYMYWTKNKNHFRKSLLKKVVFHSTHQTGFFKNFILGNFLQPVWKSKIWFCSIFKFISLFPFPVNSKIHRKLQKNVCHWLIYPIIFRSGWGELLFFLHHSEPIFSESM